MLCYLIGDKISESSHVISLLDDQDAFDYFSALEHSAYEVMKSETHSFSLLKDCNPIIFFNMTL